MKKAQFFYLLRRGFFSGGGEVLGPVNEVAPVISGTAERGETLSSTTGTWTGTGTISYAYQWRRNGAAISGATSATYILVADDDNKFITCLVTATDDEGSNNKASNSLGPVLAAPLSLTDPVASGTAQVGQTLSTTDGTWQGIATITFAYQWRRDAVNISGATSSTYTLVAADYSTDVDCVVTATNSLGSANADSNDIANIAGTAPSISGVPTLSGTAKVDSTLTATAASVSGVPTPTTSFQWQRSDNGTSGWANISGATSSTYTAVSVDENKYLRAVQTSTNAVGSDSANSASSAQVAAAFTGLLDTYSGAAAAYSLRLLDSTYSGNAIKVRRSSDNAEQDIAFVDNELDTSSLTTFCSGTDGFVTTWYDQSGNTRNVINSTASTQPKIYDSTGGITTNANSNNAVQYISGDFLRLTSVTGISTTNVEAYGVFENSHTRGVLFYSPNFIYFQSGDGSSALSGVGSPSLRVNGVDEGSITTRGNLYTDINGGVKLFGVRDIVPTSYTELGVLQFGAAAIPQIGFLAEYIVWDSSQSGNRTGIETNINDFYSIY
tara:strand:- start:2985 stop:4643 length:1659 start_codon:yes stop_codon:yes gene_type:complete